MSLKINKKEDKFMFLNNLKGENKQRFLKLCVYAALSNNVFEEEQREMILAYCHEMNIPENVPDVKESFEDILLEVAESSDNIEKNIIILEIFGLVKSDGIYDNKEKEFMEKLAKGINAKEDMLERINNLLDIYTAVYKELCAIIF